MKAVLFCTAAVLTTACAPQPGGETPPASPPEACAAAAYRDYIGRPASSLDGVRFSQPVRVIGPGDAVTMDFNPRRLNFKYDGSGTIYSVTCG